MMKSPIPVLGNMGIEAHVILSGGGITVTNEYADKIEKLLSPLVGDLMAKMALKSQCKSLGIVPEDIGLQHLQPLATKIGFALAIHGHREKAENIVSIINNMSSDVLEKRGKVKGTILSSLIDIVALKWGAGLAQDLKRITGHTETFKPGTWHTLIMLESTLGHIESSKAQGGKFPSYDIGYQLMSNLKFDNARYLFADSEKSTLDTISNLKLILELNEMRVDKKGDKEINFSYGEETTQHFNQFLMGLCDGILKLRDKTGKAVLKHSSASSTVISIQFY